MPSWIAAGVATWHYYIFVSKTRRGDEYDYNTTGDRQASSYSRGGRHVHSDGDGDSEEDDDYGGPSIPPPPGFIEVRYVNWI